MGVLTGDYPAAAASLAQAMAIYGDLDDGPGHAHAQVELGFLGVLTGDYPAAAASYQQALALPAVPATGSRRRPPSTTWGWCSS